MKWTGLTAVAAFIVLLVSMDPVNASSAASAASPWASGSGSGSASGPGSTPAPPSASASAPTTTIQSAFADSIQIAAIEFEGNHRTSSSVLLAALPIAPGDRVALMDLDAIGEQLEARGVAESATVHTRGGESPGSVTVVVQIEERRPDVRIGLGHEDLSGWYLVPLEFDLDNQTGHGERIRFGLHVGYRVTGLLLELGRPAPARSGFFWNVALRGENVEHIYFHEGNEVAQNVGRGGLELSMGRLLSSGVTLEAWLAPEGVEVDSTARVYRAYDYEQEPEDDLERGDKIEFADLPPEIRLDIVKRGQTRIGAGVSFDTRTGTGIETRGLRGAFRVETVGIEKGKGDDFARVSADLRGQIPLTNGIGLAVRGHSVGVGASAPFFERVALGGLYTVRGFPSQSLSPARGNLRLLTGSAELRTTWIGPDAAPRLAGIAFLDAGIGWDERRPDLRDGSAGAGFGLRVRIPWIQYLGLDFGFPLSKTKAEEPMHVNAGLGWTF